MKYVVIRDDDICALTPRYMLEELYRPVLDAGKPVSLSVIPAIEGGEPVGEKNGPFWDRYKLNFSPCLPPDKRAVRETHPLEPGSEIVDYLNHNPAYEIVQHGYNHISVDGLREGMLTDRALVRTKVEESAAILEECFGRRSEFFVVPWDDASSETLAELKIHFKGISLQRIGKRHVSPLRKIPAALRKFSGESTRTPYFWDGDFLLLEYPGPILSMFNDYTSMKGRVENWLKHHDTLVLVNHYWEYFWDWEQPNGEFLAAWHGIARYLLERDDVDFTTFSGLYDCLGNR